MDDNSSKRSEQKGRQLPTAKSNYSKPDNEHAHAATTANMAVAAVIKANDVESPDHFVEPPFVAKHRRRSAKRKTSSNQRPLWHNGGAT